MIEKNKFTKFDSLAVWNVPNNMENFNELTPNQQDELFDKVFKSKQFSDDWLKQIRRDRVVLGQNPGDKGDETPDHSLWAFHYGCSSNDARLAAALYNTSFWGAVMTDLTQKFESNSKLVDTNSKDADVTIKHLNDTFNITDDAVILCLGDNAYKALKAYRKDVYHINKNVEPVMIGKHLVIKVPHYSGSNNDPRTRLTNKKVLDILNDYDLK